jgi:hypothetical protein
MRNDIFFVFWRKHRVEILLPIVAAICVLFVKSTVKYENDLGILKLRIWSWQ